MKYSRLLKATGVTGLAVAALVGGQAPAVAADANYVLNTASTGGTYHPVGTAISTLTKIKLLPKQKLHGKLNHQVLLTLNLSH